MSTKASGIDVIVLQNPIGSICMKKIIFSILLISSFASYVLFLQFSPKQDATNLSGLNVKPVSDSQTGGSINENLTAVGKIWVTNTYSSPIEIVKATRFISADGKLFHLLNNVTIPASYGQVLVDVYADQKGSSFAIGPTTFSIPGLPTTLQSFVSAKSDTAFSLAQPAVIIADSTTPATSLPASSPTTQTSIPAKPTVAPTPSPTPTPTPTPVVTPPVVKPKGQYRDGTYTGDSVDVYYGYVQISATVSGGKITDVKFLDHPQDRSRSVSINDYAMPILRSEALQAQSSNVDAVSGASATSDGFVQSLASALSQAKI